MILGWALPKRIKLIKGLPETTSKTHQLYFRGALESFPIHSIRLDMPKYRLENGRTQAAQDEYVARHKGLSEDFFVQDPETTSAQKAQHTILSEMMSEEGLLEYFKKGNLQTEPVILDEKGYLVNGNRRVCTWRHLLDEDGQKYRHFVNIHAIVLPQCSEEDIDDLEAQLQIQQDIKAGYSWIDRAFMLRQKLDKYDAKKLALRYLLKPKEIKTDIALIDYVDDYLVARGTPRLYSNVVKEQHTFRRLFENRVKLSSESERQILDHITYKLIDDPNKGGLGRVYTAIPDIRQAFPKVVAALEKDLNKPEEKGKPKVEITKTKKLLGTSSDSSKWILDAVKSKKNTEKVINAVVDVIQTERQASRTKKDANAVLKNVADANTALKSAINLANTKSKKEGIEAQILEVEKSIEELKKWLKIPR
jgi:hypothetical protein